MSASTDALAEALANQIEEQGQSFTVDGEADAVVGLIEDTSAQLMAGLSGMEDTSEITITIPRASWTPTHKAVITLDGEDYTVDRINGKIPHKWTFTATNRQS